MTPLFRRVAKYCVPRDVALNPMFRQFDTLEDPEFCGLRLRYVFSSHGGELGDWVCTRLFPYSWVANCRDAWERVLAGELRDMHLLAESRFDSGGLCEAEQRELDEWRAQRAASRAYWGEYEDLVL